MLDIIKNLINIADKTEDFDTQIELLQGIRDIIEKLASTINAPSNWRDIGEKLEKEYRTEEYNYIYEALQLWDFQDYETED